MKYVLPLSFVLLFLNFNNCYCQCWRTYSPPSYHENIELNLEENLRLVYNKKISYTIESVKYEDYSNKINIIRNQNTSNLEYIYQEIKNYLIDHFGQDVFCERFELNDIELYNFVPGSLSGKGQFTYKFFKKYPVVCQKTPSEYLKFKFFISKTGSINIEYPKILPECPTLDFNLLNITYRWIYKRAVELGLGDYNDFGNFRKDEQFYYLENRSKHLEHVFDIHTGNYVKDISTPTYFFSPKLIREIMLESEYILDAVCVSVKPFKGRKQWIYSNYGFKVINILKGGNVSDTIYTYYMGGSINGRSVSVSDGLDMPHLGERVYLGLKKTPKSEIDSIGNPLKKQIMSCVIEPFSYSIYSDYNIKSPSSIVPLLNNYIRVDSVNYTPDKVSNWLDENKKSKLIDKMGLTTYLYEPCWTKDNHFIYDYIFTNSTKDFCFLNTINYTIEYDTSFVGSFVVRNNNVKVSRLPFGWRKTNSLKPEIMLNQKYEIELKDLSYNQYQISIRNVEKDDYIVLQPTKLGAYSRIMVSMQYKTHKNKKGQFYHKLVSDPFKNVGQYYDYEFNRNVDFAYQWSSSKMDTITSKDYYPKIERVYPKRYKLDDIITIEGSNLLKPKNPIYFPVVGYVHGVPIYRHIKILPKDIIESSETKIAFQLHDTYPFMENNISFCYPSIGSVKLRSVNIAGYHKNDLIREDSPNLTQEKVYLSVASYLLTQMELGLNSFPSKEIFYKNVTNWIDTYFGVENYNKLPKGGKADVSEEKVLSKLIEYYKNYHNKFIRIQSPRLWGQGIEDIKSIYEHYLFDLDAYFNKENSKLKNSELSNKSLMKERKILSLKKQLYTVHPNISLVWDKENDYWKKAQELIRASSRSMVKEDIIAVNIHKNEITNLDKELDVYFDQGFSQKEWHEKALIEFLLVKYY